MKWNLKPKIQSKKKPSIVDQYENLKGQLLRSEIAPKGGVIPHSSYLQVATLAHQKRAIGLYGTLRCL